MSYEKDKGKGYYKRLMDVGQIPQTEQKIYHYFDLCKITFLSETERRDENMLGVM